MLTVSELANRLRLSPIVIYRNPQKFKMIRLGGAWRITQEALDELLRNGTREG
jgi:hypothetical protein